MGRIIAILLLILLFSPSQGWSQTSGYFRSGTQELGLANLGVGYSDPGGLSFSANVRYQYYFLNRFAVGGSAFYNNFNDREWMGVGPVASYILFTYYSWFARFDQQVTAAKFNGFDDPPASLYGTSAISINYLPLGSNFFIGGGYARSYALTEGRVLWPNSFQVFGGFLWH